MSCLLDVVAESKSFSVEFNFYEHRISCRIYLFWPVLVYRAMCCHTYPVFHPICFICAFVQCVTKNVSGRVLLRMILVLSLVATSIY